MGPVVFEFAFIESLLFFYVETRSMHRLTNEVSIYSNLPLLPGFQASTLQPCSPTAIIYMALLYSF
jgi:hypothetical protein